MIGDTTVTLCAIIKGSGMIAPDMATMLGYVFTDAAVEPASPAAAFGGEPQDVLLHHRG
jgi:N-acetylglutamate synthase/N-acetylornithine aminotransferase